MADIFTGLLGAVGIGSSIAGMSTSAQGADVAAKGAALTGQATSENYLFQAGVARANAQIAKQNAAWAEITGDQNASIVGAQARQGIGQTRAAQGANGLDVNTGSAKDVVDSEHLLGSEAQTTQRSNAAQQAYAYNVQAAQYEAQAKQDRRASTYALQGASYNVQSAELGGESSILSGVSSVASKWSQANQSGMFSGFSKAFS